MQVQSFSQTTAVLLAGLDLLCGGLVVLAVAVATHAGEHPWLLSALGAAFLGLYAIGRASIRTTERPLDEPRAHLWPDAIWIASLVIVWVLLLRTSPVALWIAFPLMLVALHTLGPRYGSVAVAVVTGIAIGHGFRNGVHGWASLGAALGPLVGGGVAIAVVIGLEAFAHEVQQRQALVDELRATRTDLAMAERERAILGERERLGREIHDTLAQGFSAIDLLLRAATPHVAPPGATLVQQAGQTARDNLVEARRFVRALAPADLDSVTLAAALRRVVDRVKSANQGLAITMYLAGNASNLDMDTEAALLRITQTALANVAQHASATRVDVTLSRDRGEIGLDIIDDGVGFSPGQPSAGNGYGIRSMRSRVHETRRTVRHRVSTRRRDCHRRPVSDFRGMLMIRVVIADDHPVVRAGLRALVDTQPDMEVIADFGSADDLVAHVAAGTDASVLLLDLRFGDGRLTGAEATGRIAALGGPPVLILTIYDTDADILTAVEAGATGYLLKDSPTDELTAAIRAAAAGEVALGPAVQRRLLGRMRRPGVSLSMRELEVLGLAADGASNDNIAEQLFLSRATVKTHLAHVYEKLGANSRTEAVSVARRRGLIG